MRADEGNAVSVADHGDPGRGEWRKILVAGNMDWVETVATMLRRARLDAMMWKPGPETVPRVIRWCRPLRWMVHFFREPFRSSRVIHMVGGTGSLAVLRVARFLGKRIVLHWVGTDVLGLRGEVSRGNRKRLKTFAALEAAHFADSPEIAAELREVGIEAEVFRILPDSLVPRDLPMPPKPVVLSYWSRDRRAFYGGDIVDALAKEFPEVMFYVVGTLGMGEPQHPNVKYMGRMDNLEDLYGKVSILIRVPKHDSLSVMVLEALARGRWVIYSKPFPHTELAKTLEEARAALRKCLAKSGWNETGQQYVRDHFCPQAEALRIGPIYRRVLDHGR